jgi:hypothetical protein
MRRKTMMSVADRLKQFGLLVLVTAWIGLLRLLVRDKNRGGDSIP